MSAFIVEGYSARFENQLRDIFFESSSRKNFADDREREAFFWKYLGFYLAHYPDLALIARQEDKVMGYVVASPRSDLVFEIQPHMQAFSSHYVTFPSHLHINCHADARGLGVGSKLLQDLEKKLQDLKISGLHIMTSPDSRNRSFYKKLGFDFELIQDFHGSPILMMGKVFRGAN